MRYFPVFFDLVDQKCLVLGAGRVGRRKAHTLLEAGAQVIIVDPFLSQSAQDELSNSPNVDLRPRPLQETDLTNIILAFAASADREANATLVRLCRERNVPCNVADHPQEGAFILPAVHCQDELTFAVSTGGSSPALARHARQKLETLFGREYAILSRLLGGLRPLVLELNRPQPENQAIFRSLLEEEVLEALREGDWTKCENCLKARLPQALHPYVGDLYVHFADL
ncbi:MAG: precorrin-2 dehydrogenase/sirohydrochlorin ferrochelatase family protein [Thermodesulfobacteriota bacterium]